MTRALGCALAWLEEAIATRRGMTGLFVLAVAGYGLQSVALPLTPGRDFATYLRYYEQLFSDWGSVQPMSMLHRTPVTPIVLGAPLDLLGAAVTQAWVAILYALSIVAWARVALTFGRRAALLTAAALLCYPGYWIIFHRVSTEAIFAAAFAGWAVLLSRYWLRPSWRGFALVGLAAAMLALVRPGNQVLLVLAVLPLALRMPWRTRLAHAGAFLIAGVGVLAIWAAHNGIRYDDYTVARGANAFMPFYRVYVTDHIVSPENGTASRDLARVVEERLLPEEPYRSYGLDLRRLFAEGSDAMHQDLMNLSDQVWGWDSDYSKLRAVALEAIAQHPARYAKGVATTVKNELWWPVYWPLDRPSETSAEDGSTTVVAGKEVPALTRGDPIPAPRMGLYSTTPDGSIREVWTSPTAHRIVLADPGDQRRFDELTRDVEALKAKLPAYDTSYTAKLYVNRASRWYPRPALWLAVGLIGLLMRRPRNAGLALALAAAGLLVITFTALGIYEVFEFVAPVVPAFILVGAAGLVGVKRGAAMSP